MKSAMLLLMTLLLLLSSQGKTETLLSVKPNKCVAMNKGQLCYQKLRFRFTAPTGNYCLMGGSQKMPLKCWQASRSGQYIHPFESDADTEYRLVNEQLQTVASTSVVVAWVYKKSRKRNRWRLF